MGLAAPDVLERYRRALDGFGAVVGSVGERWGRQSPCAEWDARGVLEHVIGFHDVLVLVPLGAKPTRPPGDPVARWQVTAEALREISGPDVVAPEGADPASFERLLPILTTDVLIHSWDLATAAGDGIVLPPDLCEVSLAGVRRNEAQIRASDMFAPEVEVPAGSDAQSSLLGFMGRDPAWTSV
jgi:uncharacterized protein (TIGR03086 family)